MTVDLSYLPKAKLRCLIVNERSRLDFYEERLADLDATDPEGARLLHDRISAQSRIIKHTAQLQALKSS